MYYLQFSVDSLQHFICSHCQKKLHTDLDGNNCDWLGCLTSASPLNHQQCSSPISDFQQERLDKRRGVTPGHCCRWVMNKKIWWLLYLITTAINLTHHSFAETMQPEHRVSLEVQVCHSLDWINRWPDNLTFQLDRIRIDRSSYAKCSQNALFKSVV